MPKLQDLKTQFTTKILPKVKKSLRIKNDLAAPKVDKITVNIGIGTYTKSHGKDFSNVIENLTAITGQKPVITKAKKAVSNFKTRIGDPIGLIVTLRGKRMYDFLNKLINIVFPRVRDFRGLSPKSFDGKGNYSIGFKEHTVFPEISPDDVIKIHGAQVNIITTAQNNEEGFALLKEMGMPFKSAGAQAKAPKTAPKHEKPQEEPAPSEKSDEQAPKKTDEPEQNEEITEEPPETPKENS